MKESNIILYETEEGKINVDVLLKDETIWLSQKGMSELFDVNVPAITKHLNNIYAEKELEKDSTISKMETIQKEGNRKVNRKLDFYNLDAIIAVGYRVNSKKATKFRIWANSVLKEYIIKGFKIDTERMKNGPKFGKDYYNELLDNIKEIRLSERRFYQKITDIFEVTSIDYDKKSDEAYTFFKIVQNKIHYAITGYTAAELIYSRADSNKDNMGLTSWKSSPNGKIMKYDANIAKNYLNHEELKKMESLSILFLDYAEDMVNDHNLMNMQKWIDATDELLKFRKREVLETSGNISHSKAIKKANHEYEKYRIKQDKEYISSMDELYNKYLNEKYKQ